ncbi:MAG: FxSxx-COOH system tetratricopeptide repeat protein [bacterium]|nr:FxSxx-COOH system tetratricopeptide repeat protein [bacterium]
MKKDFFISYRNVEPDNHWAQWIAWVLEEEGYSVVIYEWDFGPGTQFVSKINDALQEAERVIVALSSRYLQSEYTKLEWTVAYREAVEGIKKPLVLFRIEDVIVEGLLGSLSMVDLFNRSDDEARALVLDAVIDERRKEIVAFPKISHSAVVEKPRFPGILPDIWNVPHRNFHFMGRDRDLEKIESALEKDTEDGFSQPVAIYGLGGIGKTSLAVEFAYRNMDRYDVVWWLRSEEPAMLAMDYGALAIKLGIIREEEKDQRIMIEIARGWLERTEKKWLLVFDNAEHEDELKEYMPRGGIGNIIITSRNPGWNAANCIELNKWSRDDSIDFLLDRIGQDDRESASKLAQELDDYPLALTQAAAYINKRKKTLTGYLSIFEKHKLEVLERGKPSSEYHSTVATTWEMAFREIAAELNSGADLIKMFSFMAPDDIPINVIINGAGQLPDPLSKIASDDLLLDDALETLLRYSLIYKTGNSVSVHRLVQDVTRERLNDDEKKAWALAAISLVNFSFPSDSDDPKTWDMCVRLLQHTLVATGHAESMCVAEGSVFTLLNRLGDYLGRRYDFVRGKAVLNRALELGRSLYGDKHPNIANCFYNLGKIHLKNYELDEALKCFNNALEIDHDYYGEINPVVARDLIKLAHTYRFCFDFEKSRENYERAMRISESEFGPDHPEVARCAEHLSYLFYHMGEYKNSKELLDRAIKINTGAFGPDDYRIGEDHVALGVLLRPLGELERSREEIEKGLTILERLYGPEYSSVAWTLCELSESYRQLKEYEDAKKCLERALKINEKVFGSDHYNTAIAQNRLGQVLLELGDLEAAREIVEKSLKIVINKFDDNHPFVALRLNLLGRIQHAMGDLKIAKKNIERELQIDEEAVGIGHTRVASRVTRRADVLKDMGDFEGAKLSLERALMIRLKSFGPDHPETRETMERLQQLKDASEGSE